MCEEKMLVEEFGIRGAAAMFKVAGVNIEFGVRGKLQYSPWFSSYVATSKLY